MKVTLIQRCANVAIVFVVFLSVHQLSAQDRESRMERFRNRMNGMMPPGMPPGMPQEVKPEAPKEGEKKDGAKPAEPPKETGPKAVARPTAPPTAPKLDDQKLKVDEKKMVTFNFEGAPWNFVLDELSRVSQMNLDWQELPGDFLNLRNPRPYTLDEARDTINQHLMARGYTMLNNGVTLSVVNLDKLNPASVPRVSVAELDKRLPHEFVKVSFPLEWMLAETAVEEFKPMTSPKGKLTALKSTNRLEAIDAVINLREVRDLLAQAEGPGGESLVKEIVLEHTRAADIQSQLEVFLGLKKESPLAMPKDPQGQQMAMQMMQMQMQARQQQQQQQQPGGKPDPNKSKGEVHLSTNPRRNSILVQAPPDQMVVIRQTIKALDVPTQRPSLLTNPNRMKSYRLATADPAIVISTLEAVGDLAPDTRLELDKANRAIIVSASLVDQMKIQSVVKQLDGTDRSLHVIPLRRLEADQVAGTIELLLVGEKEETTQSRRRSWGYFDFGSSRSNEEEKKPSQFRVTADITKNRVLLFANEIEYQEVMKLLAELGEVPPQGGNRETIRVLDVDSEDSLIEQIRRAWPSLGPNQLNIQLPEKKKPVEKPPGGNGDQKTKPKEKENNPRLPAQGTTTALDTGLFHLAKFERQAEQPAYELAQKDPVPAAEEKSSAPAKQPKESLKPASEPVERQQGKSSDEAAPPPINITRGPDGRLVITSDDTQALDRLEQLVSQLAPPRKDYAVFHLKFARASIVKLNLEEFFTEEKKNESDSRFNRWWYGYDDSSSNKKESPLRLSKRRPLRFIYDPDSNTVLAQGADPEQLKTIEDLIQLYDQPEPMNTKTVRKTKIFQIQHSKAKIIAEAVKEVYRDLLSANDKALQDSNKQGAKAERAFIYDFGDNDKSNEINQGRFKGLLSVGVDEVSNMLIVSAPESLLTNVSVIIEELDKAAEPQATTFQVLQINRSSNAEEIQKKLAEMMGKAPRSQAPQQPQPPQQNSGRNRNKNGKNRGQNDGNNND